tara:strand:- start:1109 stop:1717 length:609 start_codon:yes stop_codon:yes gene_type:complete
MLLLNNLSYFRDDNLIFENLNLSLGNGQIIQIRGKNGSGKTTLLKVILNLLTSKTGEVFWEGQNVNKNIFNFYNKITYIADHNTSSRKLSVLDNIKFWKGLSSSKLNHDDILSLLDTFNLKKYLNKETLYLSSGEIKKLELLRLILEQKKLWLLDEPYNHLDDASIEILNQTFIDHINNDGIILFASHYNPLITNLEVLEFN